MHFTEPTPALLLTDIVIYALICVVMRPALNNANTLDTSRLWTGVAIIFLFCLYSFWGGDWFHYQTLYDVLQKFPDAKLSLEGPYCFLIKHLCPNYISFRMYVWGTAMILIQLSIRRLELKEDLTWFIFGVIFLMFFSYARVSLAVSILIYGTILVVRPFANHKIVSIALGISLIAVSFFFHKSVFMGIAVVVFCLISGSIKKKYWLYQLIVLIFAYIAVNLILSTVLSTNLSENSELEKNLAVGNDYLSRESGSWGFRSFIEFCCERIPYYLLAYLSYKLLTEYELPKGIDMMARFSIYIVILSTFFVFNTDFNTSILFGRLLRFSVIPDTFIFSYIFEKDLFPKWRKAMLITGLATPIYQLTYNFYCTIAS